MVDFGPEGIRTNHGAPEGCALVVSTNPISLASVVYGGRPVLDAEASGELTLTGVPRAVRPLRRMVSAAREDCLRSRTRASRWSSTEPVGAQSPVGQAACSQLIIHGVPNWSTRHVKAHRPEGVLDGHSHSPVFRQCVKDPLSFARIVDAEGH